MSSALASTTTKLYSAGPFGRFWRWQYKFTLQNFSSSSSPSILGFGSESAEQVPLKHGSESLVAFREKENEEIEKWKHILQSGRQMPWSTSKARKLFQATETAEQTSMFLIDNHSVLLREARKMNPSNGLEYKTMSTPITGLTTLLFGNIISSSMPELTTLELVKLEEL